MNASFYVNDLKVTLENVKDFNQLKQIMSLYLNGKQNLFTNQVIIRPDYSTELVKTRSLSLKEAV